MLATLTGPTSTQFMLWFWRQQNLYNSLVQVWAPVCYLSNFPKAVPEDNRRFRGQNQCPSSWGHARTQLGRVGQASTNIGRFLVGCSRCWQRPARLLAWRKHATTLVILTEVKSQQSFDQASTSHFFFSCETKILIELARSCCSAADQSLAHSFTQSFWQSLVSD